MSSFRDFDVTGGEGHEAASAVIAAGHPPVADKVIMIDFDGTIKTWGYLFDFPEPFTGVAEFTQMLKRHNYRIGIFTSRLSPTWLETVNSTAENHIEYITEYCNKYGIAFDFITSEKMPSQDYIDDKATRFDGDWLEIVRQYVTRGWV